MNSIDTLYDLIKTTPMMPRIRETDLAMVPDKNHVVVTGIGKGNTFLTHHPLTPGLIKFTRTNEWFVHPDITRRLNSAVRRKLNLLEDEAFFDRGGA